MSVPSFSEVLQRCDNGYKLEEQEFDLSLFRTVEKLKTKYDIRYNPDEPVVSDPHLADRCFAAARELYAEVGTYCTDTGRVVSFSLDEMDQAVSEAPDRVTWGAGADAFDLRHRPVGSSVEPFVWGGIQTLLYSDEDTMFRVYRACCRCPEVDGVWGGIVPASEEGQAVRGGTIEEIFPYRRSAELLRQAAREAGREGMCLRTGAPSTLILAAQYAGTDGLWPSDGMSTVGQPELKISTKALDRVGFALAINSKFLGGHGACIGGFSGSVEGAAIVAAAGAYQCRLMNRADVVVVVSTHMQIHSRAVRSCIWANTLACQAINRNTHLIVAGPYGDHPAAGPGTEQYFYETAAAVIPVVASGGHPFGGTRKYNIGKTLDYGSPVESEFMGRICKAVVGIEPAEANRISAELLERYEDKLKDAPAGATLHELYDLEAERPKPAYRELYDKVVAELRTLGVPLEPYPAD